MFAILGVGIACMTAALAAFGRWQWQRRRNARSMTEVREALDACSSLLQLVRNLQQHRGMSSAWLSGDTGFASRLAEKRADILADIAALNDPAACESERPYPCFTRNDLALYRYKWTTLVENLGDLGVEQNIAQHSQLITQALDWLANFGEARIELPAGEFITAGLARNFSHRLPSLAETLGQARALGLGAAASGACKPVTRVRLMFLATRGESLLTQAVALDDKNASAVAARVAVLEMIKIIRCDILSDKGVAIGADTYYALATRAIDALYAWMDACVATLEAEIASMRSRPTVELREHGLLRQPDLTP